MIVQCPECTTEFKLPAHKVSETGVKLRCSKCGHVFRCRAGAEGTAEIFYNESDLDRNAGLTESSAAEATSTDDDASPEIPGATAYAPSRSADAHAPDAAQEEAVDEAVGNSTQFGLPTSAVLKPKKASISAKLPLRHSRSASSDYNPFPHANLSPLTGADSSPGIRAPLMADEPAVAAPGAPVTAHDAEADFSGESAHEQTSLGWQDEATRLLAQSDDDDPFAGAFDTGVPQAPAAAHPAEDAFDEQGVDDEDPFGDAFGEVDLSASEDAPEPGNLAREALAESGYVGAGLQQPETDTRVDAPLDSPAAAIEAAAVGAQAGASPFALGHQAYRMEDMVDPDFGKDGVVFDAERGLVEAAAPAQAAPVPSRAPAPRPAAPLPHAQPPAARAAAAQPAEARQPAEPAERWQPEVVDDAIEPHQIGGHGPQKAANFVLILLCVSLAFLGTTATLSGGFLDFSRFSHMLEVAYQGAEFEPRAEWAKPAAPVVTAAPEDPIRIESVFATAVTPKKGNAVILLRGEAKNVATQSFQDVKLRAILYDKNERPIGQTTGFLGARVQPTAIANAEKPEDFAALLPSTPTALGAQSTQPFSLIFEQVPGGALENIDVSYRVEIVEKSP